MNQDQDQNPKKYSEQEMAKKNHQFDTLNDENNISLSSDRGGKEDGRIINFKGNNSSSNNGNYDKLNAEGKDSFSDQYDDAPWYKKMLRLPKVEGFNAGYIKCLNIQLTPKQNLIFLIVRLCIAFALMFTGAYLFLIKLDKTCPEDKYEFPAQCVELLNSSINKWIKMLPVICTCLMTAFVGGYYKLFDPYRAVMFLSGLEMIILCFCIYSLNLADADERNFASAQTLALLGFLVVFGVFFLLGRLIFYIYHKQKIIFSVLMAILLGFFAWAVYEMAVSCDGWEQGIRGELNYNEPYASVNAPSICWPDFLGNTLDLSPKTCEIKKKNYGKEKEWVLDLYGFLDQKSSSEKKNIINDTKYLTWPLSSKFEKDQRTFDVMQKNIMKGTKTVDTPDEAFNNGHEVVIDLDNLEFKVKVTRDADLVKKRLEEAGDNVNNSIADNIIIIYIDTLSRKQTHRCLPKSMEFFKQFVDDENLDKEFYEFFRFHAIDKYTLNNNMKLHFDNVYSEVYDNLDNFSETNKKPNLMKELKKSGHIVAHSSNTCTSQCAFREENESIQKYFDEESADHEFLMYDPTYINPDNYFDSTRGPASLKRRCAYSHDTNYFNFQYGLEFLEAYKNDKKALYLEFTDSHEITSEVVKYVDDNMAEFLNEAQKRGLISKSTMIYVVADHGQHLLPTFYMAEKVGEKNQWEEAAKHPHKTYTRDVYKLERMLPVFQLAVTKDIMKNQEEAIKNVEKNTQITFGMGDARNTFLASANGPEYITKNNRGTTIFDEWEPSRDCRDIGMVKELSQEQFCVSRPRF